LGKVEREGVIFFPRSLKLSLIETKLCFGNLRLLSFFVLALKYKVTHVFSFSVDEIKHKIHNIWERRAWLVRVGVG